jgi:hypothetical protein
MYTGIVRVCTLVLAAGIAGCGGGDSRPDADARPAHAAKADFGPAAVGPAPSTLSADPLPPAAQSPAPQSVLPASDGAPILPGFQPLATDGAGTHLSAGRRYDWAGQLLPAAIESRGRAIAEAMQLVVRSGGEEAPVTVASSDVLHSGRDRVEIRTTGTAAGKLQIEARTVVEYDGMGIVDIVLTPAEPVSLDQVDFRVNVARLPEQQVLGFSAENIYWPGKDKFLEPCYRGAYQSVVGFVGRQSSFWWLADQSDGWDAGSQPATEIRCTPDELQLTQPVVIGARILTSPVHYRFAFLATPVRDLTPEYRSNRIAATPTADEARVGNVNLWWTDATSHFGLPYLDYPVGAVQSLTPAEIEAYPGVARNAEGVRTWRNLGIERLPYMSLRAISPLDAAAQLGLPEWQAEPRRWTGLEVDAPYTTAFRRPLVSLRAAGFVDHQLGRLTEIADRLDVSGFYFDQAGPIGSANAAHAASGAGGLVNPATDVLAMRDFFKRLATMLAARGRAPLIYVHNSSAPVVPAYTFVTAMVQGEELNSVEAISALDYQASVPLSYVWPLYSPQSSGVPTVWLEELWSEVLAGQRPEPYRTDTRSWLESPAFNRAWRNFMSMALLHDIPVWTSAPVARREALYGQMDRFGIAASTFTGYWEVQPGWADQPVLTSVYVRTDVPAMLVIAANVTDGEQALSSSAIGNSLAAAGLPPALRDLASRYAGTGAQTAIPGRDFALIEIR